MELKWLGGIQPLDCVIISVVSDLTTVQPVNVASIGALSSLAQPRPVLVDCPSYLEGSAGFGQRIIDRFMERLVYWNIMPAFFGSYVGCFVTAFLISLLR